MKTKHAIIVRFIPLENTFVSWLTSTIVYHVIDMLNQTNGVLRRGNKTDQKENYHKLNV